MIFTSKKDILKQIAENTASTESIKANTAAIIENSTAQASQAATVGLLNAAQQEKLITDGILTQEQIYQIAACDGLTLAEDGTLVATKALNAEKLKQILISQGVQKENAEEVVSEMALANAKATTSAGIFSNLKNIGTKAKTLFLSLPTPAKVIAIGTAIFGVIKGIRSRIKKSNEETRQEIIKTGEKAQESINNINSDINNNRSNVDSAIETYKKFQNGVDTSTNKNLSLSNDEYQEFLDANKNMAELFPQLIKGYDENGNAILKLGDNAEQTSSKIQTLYDSLYATQLQAIETSMPDVFNQLEIKSEEIDKEINNLDSKIQNLKKNTSGQMLDDEDVISMQVDKFFNSDAINHIEQGENIDAYSQNIVLPDDETLKKLGTEEQYIENLKEAIKTAGEEAGLTKELIDQIATVQIADNGEKYFDLSIISGDQFKDIYNNLQNGGFADFIKSLIDIGTEKTEAEIKQKVQEINNFYKSQLPNIFAIEQNKDNYKNLDGNMASLVDSLITNFDYASNRSEIEKYGGDIIKYLEEEVLNGIYNATPEQKEAIQEAYSNLLNIDPDASLSDNMPLIRQYINTIAKILNENPVELAVQLGFDLESDKAKIKKSKDLLEGHISENKNSEALKGEAANWVSGLSDKELTLWLNCGISDEVKFDTKQDFLDFIDTLKKDATVELNVVTPLSTAKTDLSGFEDIYDEIHSKGDDLSKYESVSADSLEGLREKYGEINGGISYKNFVDTLTLNPGDVEKAQDAMDDLITAYLDTSDLLDNLDESTAEYTKSELEKIGITNADEFVEDRLNETTQKVIKSYNEFSTVVGNNVNVLKEGKVGTDSYNQSLINIKNSMEDLIKTNIGDENLKLNLSDDFIIDNLDDIIAAANGSTEAIERLKIAISQDIAANIEINAPTGAMEEGIRSQINNWIENADIENIEVGTFLNDTPLIKGLNNLVDSGKITRDSMNAILSGIGVKPEITEEPLYAQTPASVIEYSKGTVKLRKVQVGTAPSIKYSKVSNASTAHYSKPSSSSSSSGSGGGSGSGSNSNENTETFDWVEKAIQRCEEAITKLDKVVTNSYTSWTNRNKNLASEISKTASEITLQSQAYQTYMNKANSIGLSETYKQKVQNGKMQIEEVKDEALKTKIQDYQTWYEKAIACKDAIDDLNIKLSEFAKQKFDNIISEFEEAQQVFSDYESQINSAVSLAETRGRVISKAYYQALLSEETKNNKSLINERNKLQQSLNEAVSSGKIVQYSEAWYEMKSQIESVNNSIIESNNSMQEFNNSMRQADWDLFDLLQDKVNNIANEIEFVNGLLENKGTTNENILFNGLNEYGLADLGNNAANYNIYLTQAKKYAEEIKKINSEIAKDPANKELLSRREDLLEAQQDSINAAQDERQAMIDLARSGYDSLLEYMQKLIDKKKEALQSEKDLYDYQKTIAEKTDNIASIQKQLSVYENDNSEEGRKKLQQLQNSLEEAQQDLKDTEYDKYISDQEKMLDDMYQNYSDNIDEKFEDTDALISELLGMVNDNSSLINETINDVATDVGYTLSNELEGIWKGNNIVSDFSNSFSNYSTTIQSILNGIKASVDNMLNIANSEANSTISNINSGNITSTTGTTTAMSNVKSSVYTSNTSTKSTSSNNLGSPWIYKKDYYPKEELNKTGSLIDALKYKDIDPSYAARKKYYSSLGGNGTYTSTTSQNSWLLSVLRKTFGFSSGGIVGDVQSIAKKNGDDGFTINTLKKGEAVLTPVEAKDFKNMVGNLQPFNDFVDNIVKNNNIPKGVVKNNSSSVQLNIGTIELPNVTKPEEFSGAFINAIKNDKNISKAIQAITIDMVVGKSSKKVNRF